MQEIFISYSHHDKDFVDLLQNGLNLAGRTVWRDIDRIRGGQVMAKEVGAAIHHACLFLPIITDHFDQSAWLHHELAKAIDLNVPVLPVLINGITPPLTVYGSKQIRVSVASRSIPAPELITVISEISEVVGYSRPTDYDEDNMDSSDGIHIGTDDLEKELIGSRWTWCENDRCSEDGLWIEFQANGKLKRSWRSDPGHWKVSQNGFVIYKPHILRFDDQCQTFQGATADPANSIPERSGQRIIN